MIRCGIECLRATGDRLPTCVRLGVENHVVSQVYVTLAPYNSDFIFVQRDDNWPTPGSKTFALGMNQLPTGTLVKAYSFN